MISFTKDWNFSKFLQVPEQFIQQTQSIRGMISLTKDRHEMCDYPKFFRKFSKSQTCHKALGAWFPSQKTATRCVIIWNFTKFLQVPELFIQQLQSIRGLIYLTKDRNKMCDNQIFFQDPDILKFVQVQNLNIIFQLAFPKQQGLEDSL